MLMKSTMVANAREGPSKLMIHHSRIMKCLHPSASVMPTSSIRMMLTRLLLVGAAFITTWACAFHTFTTGYCSKQHNYRFLPSGRIQVQEISVQSRKQISQTTSTYFRPAQPVISKAFASSLNNEVILNFRRPTRISSHDAAALIRRTYAYCKDDMNKTTMANDSSAQIIDKNDEDGSNNGLLIITSDASRGANRITGLASLLRILPNAIMDSHDKKNDKVTIATRRMQSTNAQDISLSEVAAIALGLRTALAQIPRQKRRRILILTDSTSAISFFCGSDYSTNGNDEGVNGLKVKRKCANHPHYKVMQSLIQETLPCNDDGEDTAIVATNKNSFVAIAKVKSAHLGTDGFFDHDVTDILSSYVRGVANHNRRRGGTKHAQQKHNLSTPDSTIIQTLPLRSQDLDYLAKSDTNDNNNVQRINRRRVHNNKQQIQIKKESGERLKRCRARMGEELGLSLPTPSDSASCSVIGKSTR